MNNSDESPAIKSKASKGCFILLRISAAPWPEIKPQFPETDFNSTALLALLLEASLQNAGLLIRKVWSVGPFGESFYKFQVTEPGNAIQRMVKVLRLAQMEPLAKLAWYDSSELIWRTCWPEGDKCLDGNGIEAEVQIATKRVYEQAQMVKAATALLEARTRRISGE